MNSLIAIDHQIDQKEEKIYTDFSSYEFSEVSHPFRLGETTWGEYCMKPVSQIDFEAKIEAAISEIVANDYSDLRPKVQDTISGRFMLVDSGAALCCWPVKGFKNVKVDESKTLQAVNGETMSTYGTQTITFRIGGHTFTHPFLLAAVTSPVFGIDFLFRHRFDLKWMSNGKCKLSNSRKVIFTNVGKVNHNMLELAVVSETGIKTFKQWSDLQNLKNAESMTTDIPSKY